VWAAPLIRRAEGVKKPIDVLDTENERRRLKDVVARSRCGVRWSETVATTETFWRVRKTAVTHGA
jgi:hypothetical protein